MKGIIKGSVFSAALIVTLLCIASVVRLYIDIPDTIMKGILWSAMGICIFTGCVPVSRSSANNKLIRGISCSALTIFILWISACIAGKSVPSSSAFYSMALICFLCGILGSFVGARK